VGRIEIDSLVKEYPGGVRAVDGVSLQVEEGEFIVLVGPSGCGKTTLLRSIAGLEEVTGGRISIGGRDVTHLAPRDRDIAMVFQNYALYPHMTVRRNLGYGLKVRGVGKNEIGRRVEDVSRLLVLDQLLDRRPASLSGGQRQRVAIGRAMVREPAAFLMDEPLSNLDAKLRVLMRAELARLHQRLGVTTVYVTHDQVEAMTLGHRVAVMRDGVIQQVDAPQTLYKSPANLFVAAFIGSPAMNLVSVECSREAIQIGDFSVPVAEVHLPSEAREAIVGVRPEAFEDSQFSRDTRLPTIEVQVDIVEELGADTYVSFGVAAPKLAISDIRAAADGEDDSLFAREQATFLARVDPRTRARAGGRLRLSVDPAQFYYFDPKSGAALSRRNGSEPASHSTLPDANRSLVS
jgi:multiple sugar transport system ATP-binding protein